MCAASSSVGATGAATINSACRTSAPGVSLLRTNVLIIIIIGVFRAGQRLRPVSAHVLRLFIHILMHHSYIGIPVMSPITPGGGGRTARDEYPGLLITEGCLPDQFCMATKEGNVCRNKFGRGDPCSNNQQCLSDQCTLSLC